MFFAQAQPPENLFEREDKKYKTFPERYYQQKSILRAYAPQVLAGVVDEESYFVGAGEVFRIHIWSEIENEFDAAVNPHGNIFLPTVCL
jgi:protein involved in polysaccharide export with SLBB domain